LSDMFVTEWNSRMMSGNSHEFPIYMNGATSRRYMRRLSRASRAVTALSGIRVIKYCHPVFLIASIDDTQHSHHNCRIRGNYAGSANGDHVL
jgi:hypothetical protein